MKRYSIVLFPKAKRQLNDIYNYYAYELDNPIRATNIFNELMEHVQSLRIFPKRCRVIDGYEHLGFRKLLAGEYFIIYCIRNETVMITHFIYSRSDIETQPAEL